ncbi:RNA polymerase sigma factor [Streptomyces torulosus]|uniref:RNA polymerase sigma factor n=1 Tax=Streptomyces torulosus TaxID=68276 RepID=UPI0006EB8270|nr:sigma-70 family RNA polymerase sigma factor [Streptomyces torulosus]
MTNFPPYEDSDGASEMQFTLPSTAVELNALHGVHYVMPPDLEAFIDLYTRPHLRYAHTMLGDKQAAKAVVQRCYSHLALNWAVVLKEESPEAYAWRLLKQRVELHLRITGSAPSRTTTAYASPDMRTVAMQRAARATLEALRRQFEVMESALGLYTAIATLPERQYDVIVLHYVLGYPTEQVANIMGIKPDTVRGHRRSARERIASKLGLNVTAGDEEKE